MLRPAPGRMLAVLVALLLASVPGTLQHTRPSEQEQGQQPGTAHPPRLQPANLTSRILLVPAQWTSHMTVTLKVGSALAKRGHTVLAIVAEELVGRAQAFLADQFDGRVPDNVLLEAVPNIYAEVIAANFSKANPFEAYSIVVRQNIHEAQTLLTNATLMARLRAFNATLSMGDDVIQASWLLPEALGLRHINIDLYVGGAFSWEFVNGDRVVALSFVPSYGSHVPGGRMGLGQRIQNLLAYQLMHAIVRFGSQPVYEKLRRELGLGPQHEARSNALITIVNAHVGTVTEPFPVPPRFKLVGPLLPHAPRVLPDELRAFIEGGAVAAGRSEVVLVSFGSVFDLPNESLCCISHALHKLGARMVWKLGRESQAWLGQHCASGYGALAASGRLYASEWMPQNDVLGHPNVSLFLTHGGVQSFYEAAYQGKPMVVVPIMGDQLEHAVNIAHRCHMGKIVHKEQLLVRWDDNKRGDHPCSTDASPLLEALTSVLEDAKYRQAAQDMSRRLQAIKPAPAEQAADWVEYAIATGLQPFFHTVDAQLPWWERYMVDALAVLVIGLVALVLCGMAAAKLAWRKARSVMKQAEHGKSE